MDRYRSFYEFFGISSCDPDFTLRPPTPGGSDFNCRNDRGLFFISPHFSFGISDSHTTCKNRFFFQSRFCDRFAFLSFESLGLILSLNLPQNGDFMRNLILRSLFGFYRDVHKVFLRYLLVEFLHSQVLGRIPTSNRILRSDSKFFPRRIRIFLKHDSIVQTTGTSLPKFDSIGTNGITSPMIRKIHFLAFESFRKFFKTFF